ncbi:MAG: hypothetical protein O2856_19165 [Planctomycetota bacterium]|nr:hypothetical protein [Planctomycetota bacterium]
MNLISNQPDEKDEQGYFILLASSKVKAKEGHDMSKTVLFVVEGK